MYHPCWFREALKCLPEIMLAYRHNWEILRVWCQTIPTKQVIISLLVDGLAYSLLNNNKKTSMTVKQDKVRYACVLLPIAWGTASPHYFELNSPFEVCQLSQVACIQTTHPCMVQLPGTGSQGPRPHNEPPFPSKLSVSPGIFLLCGGVYFQVTLCRASRVWGPNFMQYLLSNSQLARPWASPSLSCTPSLSSGSCFP